MTDNAARDLAGDVAISRIGISQSRQIRISRNNPTTGRIKRESDRLACIGGVDSAGKFRCRTSAVLVEVDGCRAGGIGAVQARIANDDVADDLAAIDRLRHAGTDSHRGA